MKIIGLFIWEYMIRRYALKLYNVMLNFQFVYTERKKSDYEIKCLVAIGMDGLSAAVGRGGLWRNLGTTVTARQSLETRYCTL